MKLHTILRTACAVLAFAVAGPVSARDGQVGAAPASIDQTLPGTVAEVPGIGIPDSRLARDAATLVRDAEGDFLYQHSLRVYYWAALAGKRKGLIFDPDLLYVAAMFHDFGLTAGYGASHLRYEVDGADAARNFLREHGVPEDESQKIWLAISLHTTNGVSPHLYPIAALLAEGANMDLVGAGYDDFTAAQRDAVEVAHPHSPRFAEDFMQALYDSLKHRPETTQGTGLADILAYKDPDFRRRDFSSLMRNSHWATDK